MYDYKSDLTEFNRGTKKAIRKTLKPVKECIKKNNVIYQREKVEQDGDDERRNIVR